MKRFYNRILVAAVFFCSFEMVNAQAGCPSVSAGSDVTLPCGTTCTNLTATAFQSGATTQYGVSQIPYAPFSYTTGTSVIVNQDDIWSDTVILPFTFCFFGNAYTRAVIGANGLISFETDRALQGCDWDSRTWGTLPNTQFHTNSIMGVFQDIDPSLGGTIKYDIIGTAPCRILVVSFYQVPMYNSDVLFSSCNGKDATSQIAIYETTNVIEVYVAHKDACPDGSIFTPGWNDGLGSEGILDATGTVAYVVPGRNNSVWTANNDAWRFTPNGPTIISTIDWFNGVTQIGTGATINVCPGNNTTYTAQATYLPCAGGTPVIVTDNVNVNLAGTLVVNTTAVQNVSCFGGTNGSITVSAVTGNPPLNYGWTDGATTLTRTGLSAGTYVFTASDALGCTRTDSVVLTQPTQLTVNVPDVSQTNCSGAGTGTLLATTSGGTYGYSYSWNSNPVQTDSILDAVLPQTYAVTVTDSKGCTATDNGTLTIVAGGNNMAISNPIVTNVNCFGQTNGSVVITVSGGGGVYNYNWSNAQNTASATGLSAGPISVLVDDGNGCTASGSYNITQPTALVIDSFRVINIGCTGSVTGSIDVFVSGGTVNYTYAWVQQSNSATYSGSSLSGLNPDTYNLTVTDANACSVIASYQITAVTPLTFAQSSTDVTCNGGNDGTATITINTGNGGYTYNWNGAGATANSTTTGLIAGTVNVTVSDAFCSATAALNINEPVAIVITPISQTDVSCFGGNNGTIDISTSGGVGTITPSWSNGGGTNSITGLIAGTYTVTATDANTCSSSASYVIAEPALLVIDSAQVQNIGCAGGNTGSITAFVSGGTVAYTYDWVQQSNSVTFTGSAITNLMADNYDLTVTDANSCTATASYAITAITLLTTSQSFTDVTCNGGTDGTATVNVLTGTPPYSFSWNGTPATANNVFTGASAGNLFVIVADANCTANLNFVIGEPSAVTVSELSRTAISCFGGTNGTITIDATGGTPGVSPAYTFAWSNTQTGPTATGLSTVPVTVTATDGSGCTATNTFTLTEPAALSTLTTASDAVCYQAPNGMASTEPAGGTPPYSYLWSNFGTTKNIFGLVAGVYSCTVTDQGGCSVTTAGVVNEPSNLLWNTTVQGVKCIGQSNGSISVVANGGTPNYSYSATQDGSNFIFQQNGVIPGLAIGVYIIVIADNYGCTKVDTVTVPNASPDAFVLSSDSTSCYGAEYMDGAVHITATSLQNAPYQYSIDGGAAQYSGDFYSLVAGNHTLHMVSFNGCESDTSIEVLTPLPIIAEIIPDTVVLPLGETQPILLTYQNVTNPSFNWSPSEGLSCIDCPNPLVSAFHEGNYTVTVSKQNGTSTCFTTATMHLTVEPHKPLFVPNSFSPNGDGNNDMFLVYGEDIKLVDLKIFNRWGELVYKTNNQLAGWDGTYRGELQLPQVFTYTAKVTFLNDKTDSKIGTVTLIR